MGTKQKKIKREEAWGSRVLSIGTYDSIGSDMSTNDGWSYGNNMSKKKNIEQQLYKNNHLSIDEKQISRKAKHGTSTS